MKNLILSIVTFFLLVSCATTKNNTASFDNLTKIMQGHYTSEKQSISDESYFNISLRMTPIWTDKGNYLFVEQAMFDKQESPYRVRVYKVYQRNNEFVSEIYTLKNEKEWIGKWNNPKVYDALTEADIELKSGCEVVLQQNTDGTFSGKTGEKTCPSELRGASYASSIVTVTPTQIISWDQGFDKQGKQVWGAEKGGYVFEKI